MNGIEEESLPLLKNLATEVQQVLTSFYNLQDDQIPTAADFIWDSSRLTLEETFNTTISDDTPSVLISFLSQGEFAAVIYLDEATQAELAHSSSQSRLRGNHIQAYATLIEEISHFIYKHYFFSQRQKKASAPNVELQGTIDRYLVGQQLAVNYFSRTLTKGDQRLALEVNEALHNIHSFPKGRPIEYILGHQLGEQFISYLNQVQLEGKDPTDLVTHFYKEDERERFRFLLETLNLKIRVISKKEEEEIRAYLEEIGLSLRETNLDRRPLDG